MLSGLSAILDFFSSIISGVISFFKMLQSAVTFVYSYLSILPSWLSLLFFGVITVLLVRLLIDR